MDVYIHSFMPSSIAGDHMWMSGVNPAKAAALQLLCSAEACCSADLLGCPAGPSHANGGAANGDAAPADADTLQAAAAAPQQDPLGAGSVGGDTVGWVSAVASCKGTDLVVRSQVHVHVLAGSVMGATCSITRLVCACTICRPRTLMK